jgi:hypothetical protein
MQRRLLFPAVAVFSDLFAWSDIMFFFVVRAGLGKGDTVTLMLPNRADFYVPVLTAWRCGAAVSLVDPLQQPGQKFQPGRNFGRLGRKKTRRWTKAWPICVKKFFKAQKSSSYQFHSCEFHRYRPTLCNIFKTSVIYKCVNNYRLSLPLCSF